MQIESGVEGVSFVVGLAGEASSPHRWKPKDGFISPREGMVMCQIDEPIEIRLPSSVKLIDVDSDLAKGK